MIKVFCDGACEPKNPGGVPAFGYVVYHDGAWIHEESGVYSETGTSNIAEYAAVIAALAYLSGAGLTREHVVIQTDSRLIANQMAGRWMVKSPHLRILYRQAKDLERNFKKVTYGWISRRENGYADMLSRAAYDDE